MASRLRGPSSLKDRPKLTSYDEPDERAFKPYKSEGRENRYHFGMARHEEPARNGRECHAETACREDPDLLYRRSRQHFGAWDIRGVVQEPRKQEDRADASALTNGKSRTDVTRQDSVKGKEQFTETVDRESAGTGRSRKREGKSGKGSGGREEDREVLLREIEGLAVDGRSPDRRIRAMIERFKSREEGRSKSRREHGSASPKREHRGRSKSGGRGEARGVGCEGGLVQEGRGRAWKKDGAGEAGGSRSADRGSRSAEKVNDSTLEGEEDSRRAGSFRRGKDARSGEKSCRRKSRETEDDQHRPRDSSKRRSYAYEGSPEDFDVRIQRYERAQPEARKDAESSRRSSSRDVEQELSRKESSKEQDRQTARKNSFKLIDPPKKSVSRDRESSLGRRTSFKDQDESPHRKNSLKGPTDASARYFGKEQELEVHRRSSMKDQSSEPPRRSAFKEQTAEYGRISFKSQDQVVERKNPPRGPSVGGSVSRITFKDHENELGRANAYKDPDVDVGRVTFKDHGNDSGRRNSLKEKTVEFGGISFKEHDGPPDTRDPCPEPQNELEKPSFREYGDPDRSPSGRCVEFGKVSFKDEEDEPPGSPVRDQESPSSRRPAEKRSDRHSRPLTPPRPAEPGGPDFCPRSWHESNRLFSAKYLRENARVRTTPEGRTEIVDREFLPETNLSVQEFRDVGTEGHGEDGGEQGPRGRTDSSRNGATIIRIRSGPEEPAERRRRRRPGQDVRVVRRGRRQGPEEEESEEEEEEENGAEDRRGRLRRAEDLGTTTPSRRIWNYREGGVHITDFEEGQPCLQCGETCSGFLQHTWRKNCTRCKCPREAHDVCHEEWVSVRSRLGLKGEESTGPIGIDPREKGLAWAPPGLPAHKVEEYFSMLPEISVPRLGTSGERHRDRQLAIQLPKQDLARAYCRHLNPEHASSADDFMAARNEIALDIGSVQEVLDTDLDCGVCHAPLQYGSLAVSASKLGLLYHPSCFRCADCMELLVDLAYCVHDDTLFCERHYAEQLKARCAACDELIFSGEYTKAMNKDWHSGHFCCWQCDESLTGQRYVLRDEHPYCIKCYESAFANGCEECSKIIGIDSKDLSYKDKHWHEACFLCNRCRVSLVDKQFGSKVDKIYCGNCYDAQFASRCDGCGEIFRAGTKKMEYKTRQWHEKCFCCVVCKNPIGTKSFIPREQEIYCAGCYEDKFATRCVKCNKIITSGGVTYKNEPWHRDCFTCSNCNNSLAGQRFTSRDDKPYCAECFGELFAKRCTACSKPITGIGGTRFISFEDRHWHNDCFICAGCKTSLVGRGFIADDKDIICPECAKMKLM